MKILGPNDTGRGILLEYDAGYISYEDNKRIISEMRETDFSQDITLFAVLQKYDTPNKNGRIYPELLLKRENEKYQTLIKKGGALSELNHPSCHTGDVDILTKNGWKNIKEVDEFEEIITLNENCVIENKTIYSKVKHEYNGKMIYFQGKNMDVSVTPNHKFPIINQNNKKLSFITAQEILDTFNNGKNLSNFYIPKNGEANENNEGDFFTLKGCPENEFHVRASKEDKEYYSKDLKIPKPKGIYLDKRFLKVSEVDNTDKFVYSVDVPNHVYYIRSNNKCHWSGNSSLIDLDRVSHSILETWWDGKILMGKIKLFTSPGWKKMGIVSTKGDQAAMLIMNGATLGISSRGVGSLKNVKGQNIVQDDFELVCFDLVSSPSTPGAYVFSDPNERDQYQESLDEKPQDINKMKNLMSKLDNFLTK